MTYLVDANVLGEPTKPAPNARVIEWLTAHEEDFVVDSIILGELCIGILALCAPVYSRVWEKKPRQVSLRGWFPYLSALSDLGPSASRGAWAVAGYADRANS